MYVQVISILASPGAIPSLRKRTQREFLPRLEAEPGFMYASLMAHIDHQDRAEMLIHWENEAAMLKSRLYGVLAEPNMGLPQVDGLNITESHFELKDSLRAQASA